MPGSTLQRRSAHAAELLAVQQEGRLYAILDACDAPAVPVLVQGLDPSTCVSLYRGDAEEVYADIAPYLVHVDSEALLEWILAYSVTEGWGILLSSAEPLDVVRRHLRQFLRVLDPQGTPMYFRFYDPRVLPRFLPTCSADQLNQLQGPLSWYATLSGGALTIFELRPTR